MPYIPEHVRSIVDEHGPSDVGDLTYILTKAAIDYLSYKKSIGWPIDFAAQAEAMAAFDCAAREFYRRVLIPYEEGKIRENGDVYPSWLVGGPDGDFKPGSTD